MRGTECCMKVVPMNRRGQNGECRCFKQISCEVHDSFIFETEHADGNDMRTGEYLGLENDEGEVIKVIVTVKGPTSTSE